MSKKKKESLLRLHKWRVDEARRELSGLEAMLQDLNRQKRELTSLLENERERAQHSSIGRFAFPSFAKSVEQRQENLSASMREVETQMEAARDKLNDAFQELKKIELIEAQQARMRAAEGKRQEQSQQDAVAIAQHIRNSTL